MIEKISGKKNGYRMREDSTNEEFQEICSRYAKVRCIIANGKMARSFAPKIGGRNIVTINNQARNGEFWINSIH